MSISFRYVTSPAGGRLFCGGEAGDGVPVVFAEMYFYLPTAVQLEFQPDVDYNRAFADGQPWVIFDWRGKGRSSVLPEGVTFDHFVEDLLAIIDAAGTPCDVVATGPAGGHFAVAAAHKNPELIRRLLLLDVPRSRSISAYAEQTFAFARRDPIGAMSHLLRGMQADITDSQAIQLATKWNKEFSMSAWDELWEAMRGSDLSLFSRGFRTPTLFTATEPGHAGSMLEAAAALPGARTVVCRTVRSGPAMATELRQLWDEHCPVEAPAASSPAESLTAREREILDLLAKGDSNHQIAEQLVIAPATVARHIANIFVKLGVENRTQAAAVAHRKNL